MTPIFVLLVFWNINGHGADVSILGQYQNEKQCQVVADAVESHGTNWEGFRCLNINTGLNGDAKP